MFILFILAYLLFFVVALGFLFIIIFQVIAIFTTDAPFVPVPSEIENEIVENLNLSNQSVLYDLGCGDARILIKALEIHPEIKAIGIERAFFPYLLAKFKTKHLKNMRIRREDIFKTDIKDATHFFLYLYPAVITKLFPIIKSRCKPDTIIVSCDFQIKDIVPSKVVDLENVNPNSRLGKKLFIYSI